MRLNFLKKISLQWTSKSFKDELNSDPELNQAYTLLNNTDPKNQKDKEVRQKAIDLIKSKGYFYCD